MGSATSSPKNPDKKMTKDPDKSEDHKKVFERKFMLAKDTPEPVYDLSECHLKQVPPGVFIMCKVLLKDSLLLQNNKLTTLEGGGSLADLNLLQVLNLNDNRLRKLPDQIGTLAQLRELFVAHNQLEKLPSTMGRLRKLTILDVAHNRLSSIQTIACMSELRVLNVSGNPKLQRLPNELSTCDGLIDLVLDAEVFEYPPADVLAMGTKNVLKFLSTGEFTVSLPTTSGEDEDDGKRKLEEFIANEKREIALTSAKMSEKYSKENALLLLEREALEKNYALEAEMHQKQKLKQQEVDKFHFTLNFHYFTDWLILLKF
jgi:E3 ubiquitin-protein ligase LRSAM1